VISTESRCPRRIVKDIGEISRAQDPDSIAARPGAEKVYGVPQDVTLGEVCVPLPQPAIVPSTSSPTSNRSARLTSQQYAQPSAVSRIISLHGRIRNDRKPAIGRRLAAVADYPRVTLGWRHAGWTR
jgi:hypothetical protein